MIDFDRIPKPIYDELVSLVGEEKAEAYIIKSNYNFSTINWGIRTFYIRRFRKKYPLQILIVLVLIIGWIIFSFIN
jgi:hypothetical protein